MDPQNKNSSKNELKSNPLDRDHEYSEKQKPTAYFKSREEGIEYNEDNNTKRDLLINQTESSYNGISSQSMGNEFVIKKKRIVRNNSTLSKDEKKSNLTMDAEILEMEMYVLSPYRKFNLFIFCLAAMMN